MAENQPITKIADVQPSGNSSSGDHPTTLACRSGMMGCGMGKKGLKGLLLMAACCGAPVLLLLALPLAGSALGGLGASALSTLALLACPIGMGLMMWLMMRGQQTGASQPVQPPLAAAPEVAHTLPSRSQEAVSLRGLPTAGDPIVALSSIAQGQVNGYQPNRPVVTDNDQQPAVRVQAHGNTLVVPSPRG